MEGFVDGEWVKRQLRVAVCDQDQRRCLRNFALLFSAMIPLSQVFARAPAQDWYQQ
jgi:hypothetical protein